MFSLVDILRNSRCHLSRCILAVLTLCLGKSISFAKFAKCSVIFCYPTKTTQPRPRVSQFPSLNFLVISRYSFDIIFQISQQKVFQICSTVVDDHWRISCGISTNLIISSILKENKIRPIIWYKLTFFERAYCMHSLCAALCLNLVLLSKSWSLTHVGKWHAKYITGMNAHSFDTAAWLSFTFFSRMLASLIL